MSSYFLTNPGAPGTVSHNLTKKENISFAYKEKVTAALMKMGVPLRPAELAVIDLKSIMYLCMHRNLLPNQTAGLMIDKVKEIYTNQEGNWHFSGR